MQLASINYGFLLDNWELRPRSVPLLFICASGIINKWVPIIGQLDTTTTAAKRPPFDVVGATCINKEWVSSGQLGTTAAKRPPSFIGQQRVSIDGSRLDK